QDACFGRKLGRRSEMPGTHRVRQMWISAVAVALVVSFSLSCSRNKAAESSIKVGVVLPITGREAKPGQYQREGIDLAIRQINQDGGVMVKELGQKLPIQEVFYDDSSDQAKSASLVDQGKLKKGLKIAMTLENTDHGVDYGRGIKQWIQDHPGYFNVVFSENFDLGSPDFSGLLQKVKGARADIFLADAHLQDYITM